MVIVLYEMDQIYCLEDKKISSERNIFLKNCSYGFIWAVIFNSYNRHFKEGIPSLWHTDPGCKEPLNTRLGSDSVQGCINVY